MRFTEGCLFLALLLMGSCCPLFSATAQAREIRDATDARVELTDHPQRIVTLAPSLAELAADLAGDELKRIVGVSEFTDYPPSLKKAASVGPYMKLNLEVIVSLKPDLVLATKDGNARDQVLHLRELGLPVVVVSTDDLAQIEDSMRLVASSMGNVAEGARLVRQFQTGLERIRARAKARTGAKPRVMLQLSDDPLVVAGRGSFLNQALETVGARNSFEDLGARYPRPSLEDTIRRAPERILVLAMGDELQPFRLMARKWGTLASLKASRVKVLQADTLLRPSLRLLEGLSLLEKTIYDSN